MLEEKRWEVAEVVRDCAALQKNGLNKDILYLESRQRAFLREVCLHDAY